MNLMDSGGSQTGICVYKYINGIKNWISMQCLANITVETKILSETEIPDFEELSYVWSSASGHQDIFVEAKPQESFTAVESTKLSLTHDLFEEHLRYEDRPRVL
ncbi:MAG: hypothetical protein Q9166_004211 [cf. Caloplaca sp. 2 TL-2023]